MAGLEDFREDPEWIAKRIRVNTAPEKVRESLALLLRLRLLKRDAHGKICQAETSLTTDPVVHSKEALRFYWSLFDATKQALVHVPPG